MKIDLSALARMQHACTSKATIVWISFSSNKDRSSFSCLWIREKYTRSLSLSHSLGCSHAFIIIIYSMFLINKIARSNVLHHIRPALSFMSSRLTSIDVVIVLSMATHSLFGFVLFSSMGCLPPFSRHFHFFFALPHYYSEQFLFCSFFAMNIY